MNEDYLDITKSVMISSPAGSGKTEKLARRYITLLKEGSDVERILAITFTEKAAAEMKERILAILKAEDEETFDRVREKMPRMRISTIHSFCLKLLKRFWLELDMDPSLEVIDGFHADALWDEAIYECLTEEGTSGRGSFYEIIKGSGLKGWNKLYGLLNEVHDKRSAIECSIADKGKVFCVSTFPPFEQTVSVYSKCLERYRQKKKERRCLDFNDLEILAYRAISCSPEWQNVLYAFDEHTDHILVDEFQDTSPLQWAIIDKLTEEWRSGLGAKAAIGIQPTLFLVGDDKQSIYSFRGADISIFRSARNKLSQWLGDNYRFIEAEENYRSLPAIVNFVNTLFERLMPKELYEDWRVHYSAFESTREGDGSVELILLESAGNTKDNRKAEASIIAKRIRDLEGRAEVYEGSVKRPCSFGDIAVLLRNRTYLSLFEDALRKEDIPFVVVKGIGFYNTPEVGLMKNLVSFLVDPLDDHAFFALLRSPLFSMGQGRLLREMLNATREVSPAHSWYTFFSREQGDARSELQMGLWEGPDQELSAAVGAVRAWIGRAKDIPLSLLIEEILNETGAWSRFYEEQRKVNVKKFIKLVEGFEEKGLTGLEIREKLIKASLRGDEAKATVATEGVNAVKIMTIHASKGLQFPVVFFPSLDEDSKYKSTRLIVEEGREGVVVAYESVAQDRNKMSLFQRHREKVQDEEKRLFYVAATRAMDRLFMSGIDKSPPAGKLAYLADAFDLKAADISPAPLFSVKRIRSEEVMTYLQPQAERARRKGIPLGGIADAGRRRRLTCEEMVVTEPIDYGPATLWRDVTEEIEDIRKRHGEDWIVLGRAFHRLFEGLSKGFVSVERLEQRAVEILRNEVFSDNRVALMKDILLEDMRRLTECGYLKDILLPQNRCYSELPFVLELGDRMYRGRIDRVIVRDGRALVYDYKTYPVSPAEIEELSRRYAFQMYLYRMAVEKLFSLKTLGYLFFTHEALLIPVDEMRLPVEKG